MLAAKSRERERDGERWVGHDGTKIDSDTSMRASFPANVTDFDGIFAFLAPTPRSLSLSSSVHTVVDSAGRHQGFNSLAFSPCGCGEKV